MYLMCLSPDVCVLCMYVHVFNDTDIDMSKTSKPPKGGDLVYPRCITVDK